MVDEASLAGTLSLDRITHLAAEAGAKVLLVGDYAQLQSVDAGGAFSLLVHDRDDAPAVIVPQRYSACSIHRLRLQFAVDKTYHRRG